ncbi:protein BTG1-like [Rhinatrema bivittatum]|uniref:protein BTG1-like n=1 Tax=Rhinatrema bivittatum TaxID=194408 RepID=UPI00112644CD|nr:protein BTG1-like [Rhinatrema bivittatum]XP_029455254.1 protein BTG1-like [Rhinatrema bivittatum]
MKTEISTAVGFITRLLKTTGVIGEDQLKQFSESLEESLKDHYKHHWFPQMPCKGSAYRCIRINHKMDPLIGKAAGLIGLNHRQLFQLLPSELTLWVDPFEVSYRIGEDGSICVLYESSPPVGKSAKALDNRTSCKEELRIGRSSPSKNYNMMTVSS